MTTCGRCGEHMVPIHADHKTLTGWACLECGIEVPISAPATTPQTGPKQPKSAPRNRRLPGFTKPDKAKAESRFLDSFESALESDLFQQIELAGLPIPQMQVRFSDRRRWRFDFAWPDIKLAVEVEGGVWNRGRHQRPRGFLADCEKYNTAALNGWRVLRVAQPHIKSGMALRWIEAGLAQRKEN